MSLDLELYAASYYKNAKPAGGNEFPRLKAWEFMWEYIWANDIEWDELTNKDHLEKTALHLGFYLANWGMFRGSSGLLRNSNLDFMKVLAKLLFRGGGPELFELSIVDFHEDSKELKYNQKLLNNVVASMENLWNGVSWTATLKSKILLGVWGEYPALDRYYTQARKDLYPHNTNLNKVSGIGLTELAMLIKEEKFSFPNIRTEKHKISYPHGRIFDMAMYEYGRLLKT